jgi:hypothetical protein
MAAILASALGGCMHDGDPFAGVWRLDLARTHYSPSADPRREETFSCAPASRGVRCTITSVRADGRRLVGRFAAAYDGRPGPVSGIPDMDRVTLRRSGARAVDATFSDGARPVFGYRATRSASGDTLTVISVDPVTRRKGESVVVYVLAADRR